MDTIHNTICCPFRLEIEIVWCAVDRIYRIVWWESHPGQLWEDDAHPVHTATVGDLRDLPTVLRTIALSEKRTLERQRRAAHSTTR